jgi:signal transduction histidine kinase
LVLEFRKQIVLIGIGIEFFLFFFFTIIFLGSYLTKIGILPDSQLEMYGFFGMIIFMVYLSIVIVRFHAFNIKLLATQALIWGLVALIGSQFFFIKIPINFVLNGIGFLAAIILGQFLVKSVKKEIKQREELAKLNVSLQESIKQRESLVHLVTHKVKGSFTRTKYLFAGMLDGTFGEISPEIRKRAEQGLEFDNGGIETADVVLKASNLSSGIVKYDMQVIDLKDIVQKIIDEKKIPAQNKGLKMENEIKDDKNEAYNILGDSTWIREVVNNLVENSIRYTKEGKIAVGLEKKPASTAGGNEKILFYVKDTGIGITDEDKKSLFTEGGRGKDSTRVNIDSTGYGLYSVKLIIEAHQGRVWVESEVGKGSTFYVELSAVKNN